MASSKTNKSIKRRPQTSGPPSVASSRKKTGRRVRRFYLTLPATKLEISVRAFRTNPARRSKRYKQWVVQPNILKIREIAIASKPRGKRKARKNMALSHGSFRPSISPRWSMGAATILIAGGLSSALYFGFHLQRPVSFNIKPQASKALAAAAPVSTKVMPKSIPTRLVIPRIGLNTALSQVGLQSNGAIEMPWDIETAAWYKYSPTPGELGPAIIVGHLDGANYADMTGVFWRLHELLPGDQIQVNRSDGTIATFKIIGLKQVSQNNFPTAEIYGNIRYAGLRIITCGGTFDSATGHYTQNTVVFGALE